MGVRATFATLGRMLRGHRKDQIEAWQALAARHGGTYSPEVRKFIGSLPQRVDVELGEVAVHVDYHVVSTGNSHQTYTRLRCRYLLGDGPPFRVVRAGLVASLGTALGMADLELGLDPRFDEMFAVRTAEPEATRSAWTAEACRIMVRAFPKDAVSAKKGTVAMELLGMVRDLDKLDAGVRLLGELGAAGSGLLAAVRALPDAQPVRAGGPWDGRAAPGASLVVRGVPVHLGPAFLQRRPVVRVTARGDRRLEAFEVELEAAAPLSGGLPEAALQGGTAHLVPAVAPAKVSWNGTLATVVLPGEASAGRLRAAADLAVDLAIGPAAAGAYR